MKKLFSLVALSALILVFALLTSACAQATPEIVVTEVPVEVTRLVDVIQTVEVTREVVLTVEVPVTVTPQPTPTPDPAGQATQPDLPTVTATLPALTPIYPTSTVPSQKTEGFAPLRVTNETDVRYVLEISGARYERFDLVPGMVDMRIVPEGEYSYLVRDVDGRVVFSGSFRITNPDKHELKIRENRVVFLVP